MVLRAGKRPMQDSGTDGGDHPGASGRNPPWTRDERILTLDLYLQNPRSPPGKASRPVIELSDTLNALGARLGTALGGTYRNPNGVYMKLMNLRSLDPTVRREGHVGLRRGAKQDAEVWNDFARDPAKLAATAAAIRAAIVLPDWSPVAEELGYLAEAPEGRILTLLHRTRERSRPLVEAKKRQAVAEGGGLRCEACGFDFEAVYGERGRGFVEVHHKRPLHTLTAESTTKLDDLALVCANCHRMIHAAAPWLTVEDVRSLVNRAPKPPAGP